MAISDHSFDNEQELQRWAFGNHQTFFGESVFIPGFRITTPTGKHGLPDGFAFNFAKRQWWIVECELLSHGVWPHIAEQITRFVVAARNAATLRQVRDKLFEQVLSEGKQDSVCAVIGTTPTRLLQQIELFIEGVEPSLAVFIDETNQDLKDFCDALDTPTEIYRVKKFIVNGRQSTIRRTKTNQSSPRTPKASAVAHRHSMSLASWVAEKLSAEKTVATDFMMAAWLKSNTRSFMKLTRRSGTESTPRHITMLKNWGALTLFLCWETKGS